MIVTRIDLKDGQPVRMVAELSVEEAAQIVKWTGSLTTDQTRETSEMYNALCGTIFHPFWSDGVDGYLRGDDE